MYEDYLLHGVNDVLTSNNKYFSKFTPYYNKAKELKVL